MTRADAEVPGSVVVRPEKKLDHAWPVFGGGKATPGDPEPAHVSHFENVGALKCRTGLRHTICMLPRRGEDLGALISH